MSQVPVTKPPVTKPPVTKPPVKPVSTVPPTILKGGLKKCLLIGVNYTDTPYMLAGCINDANNMSSHLKTLFPDCKDHRIITDDTVIKPTRNNILSSINWLVSGLKPGENVMFHFSGHGGLIRDRNGDEVSGFDSCIYPCENKTLQTITDDELRTLLANRIPAGSKCFVVLDCCHSGSAVDLRYYLRVPANNQLLLEENKKYTKTQGQVLFLSGCQDNQYAADTANNSIPCGALTWALLETWKQYGTGIKLKYIMWDILTFLRKRGYSQTPQLSMGQYLDLNTVFDLK